MACPRTVGREFDEQGSLSGKATASRLHLVAARAGDCQRSLFEGGYESTNDLDVAEIQSTGFVAEK